jgi:hypothetical protein
MTSAVIPCSCDTVVQLARNLCTGDAVGAPALNPVDAAAEMPRRQGYAGPVTLIGADPEPPYDRPNLSKDYLAGHAPEEWIPLRARDFYQPGQPETTMSWTTSPPRLLRFATSGAK